MKFSLNSLNKFVDLKDFYDHPSKLAHKLSSAGFEVEGWEEKPLKNTKNDIIFEIDILPHRPDCLSHFGLSRELSCMLDRKLIVPKKLELINQKQHNTSTQKQVSSKGELQVEVRQKALCSRYTGQALYGVKIAPSPLCLQTLLANLGFKSINNIVDVTNYCLIQWGQPLHAFDLDLVGEKIIVDFSQKGQNFLTLDNQEITLTGQELCIQNEKNPLALAGVIGGKTSGIHADTKNIFVESACFAPAQVRGSSKRFHIETDSSYRFSRGVASETTLSILRIAIQLMQKLAGGDLAEEEYDIWEKPALPKPIAIKTSYVERRLGMPVSPSKFQNWMKRLSCQVNPRGYVQGTALDVSPTSRANKASVSAEQNCRETKDTMMVTPPFFRFDLKIKEDLIEEYARLESYDKIPSKPHPAGLFPKADHKEQSLLSHSAMIMVHEGFYQAINHSFISSDFSNGFLQGSALGDSPDSSQIKEDLSPIFIQNPLSQEFNMMRVSLLPSLFKNGQKNLKSGSKRGRLFEIGKVFFRDNKKQSAGSDSSPPSHPSPPSPYREDIRLGLIAWGQKEELWEKHHNRLCIYDLKTALSAFLEKLYIFDYKWVAEKNTPPFMHPFQYLLLKVRGQTQAYIGSLNLEYVEQYKIRENMALGEMNMAFLLNKTSINLCEEEQAVCSLSPDEGAVLHLPAFKNLSPFPAVTRDLTFLIPKDFPAEEITKAIKKITGTICDSVKIFDVYENKNQAKEVGTGDGSAQFRGEARAVSFRLTLRSDKATLTEETLKAGQEKLIQEITSRYPVQLRQE